MDGSESVDGGKTSGDDDWRAEGTIRWTCPDLRKLRPVGQTSLAIKVRNLPWKILVMKQKTRSSQQHEEHWTLAYFLQCNADDNSPSWKCSAQAKLKIIPFKPETTMMDRAINHMFCSEENDWGFINFLAMEDLIDPGKGYINPADFSLQLEVNITADPPHGFCCFRSPRDAIMELGKGMIRLYESESLTDFTFAWSDGRELKCHRSVLAATCEVFNAMLLHDTKERRTGICEIEHVDHQTMKVIVDSLYGVDIGTRAADVPDKVFQAADKYGLEVLKKGCVLQMEVTLTVDNVVDRFVVGKRHKLAELADKIVAFVRRNYTEFADREGHREMIEKAPEECVEFFKLVGPTPNPKKRSAATMTKIV